jgi:hypothetical protein
MSLCGLALQPSRLCLPLILTNPPFQPPPLALLFDHHPIIVAQVKDLAVPWLQTVHQRKEERLLLAQLQLDRLQQNQGVADDWADRIHDIDVQLNEHAHAVKAIAEQQAQAAAAQAQRRRQAEWQSQHIDEVFLNASPAFLIILRASCSHYFSFFLLLV